MQGLITAAGLGKRAKTGNIFRKIMLPVYDFRDGEVVIRPIIDCIVNRMESIGISDITVVLDPSDAITRHYLKEQFGNLEFISQKVTRGFGDAVRMGLENIEGRFLLNAGDGILLHKDSMSKMVGSSFGTVLALMKVDNPKRYGVAEVAGSAGGAYIVKKVKEKPKHPKSNLALAAVYILDSSIRDYIAKSGASIELTDAIDRYIHDKNEVHGMLLKKGEWQSVGSAESYLGVLKRTHMYALSLSKAER
jgi:glucose-1-phosphate thymidylyltransferase